MANPTTNYGFVLPTSTDLVTDLPADFDVALQGVDTRLKALQPGTTLGDIAYSSATANTNTRLAIGSTGNVLTVSGGVPAWAAPAAAVSGLTLVKTQTIGSAVSSVTVSDAFSSTYDNYLVHISGGVTSASSGITLQLGATATGYYSFSVYGSYSGNTVNGFAQSNTTSIGDFATGSANGLFTVAQILSPNLAARTMVNIAWASIDTTLYSNWKNGYVNNATQYTAFTIAPGTGGVTMTGGTIRVYGYQKS
jgi:hypothetical protein